MRLPFLRSKPPALRALRSEHAEPCAQIHAGAFVHGWSAAEFESLIAAKNVIGVAALDAGGGALRGFALSRIAAEEAEILTVAVDGAWRARGIGRALMIDIQTRLAARHVRALFLEVEGTNASALALYARLGFREVGRREGYYRKAEGPGAAALVLRKNFA